jgi:hypothetical protein
LQAPSRGYFYPVTALPDLLDRKRHVDLEDRQLEPWLRRVGVVLCIALVVVGLANVFGQNVRTATATTAAADLEVQAPTWAQKWLEPAA